MTPNMRDLVWAAAFANQYEALINQQFVGRAQFNSDKDFGEAIAKSCKTYADKVADVCAYVLFKENNYDHK